MTRTLLEAIQGAMSHFSEKQKLVARCILADYEDAAFLTSTQLAHKSGVSDATVIRFSGFLGFDRYADMQGELRKLVRGKLSQIDRLADDRQDESQSGMMQTASHLMKSDMQNIEKTLSEMNENLLKSVVDVIDGASRVYVIGSRSAYGLAHYFSCSLAWIKENVYPLDGTSSPIFDRMVYAKPDDVAIAISFPPYPRATIQLLQCARDLGTQTIAITDSMNSPLAENATYCLKVYNELLSYADSVAPAMSVLTVLLTMIGNKNRIKSKQYLSDFEKMWDKCHIYYK